MKRTPYKQMNCSIASALEVVGEPWTLLIVRDAYLQVRRFEEFQRHLNIARNILTARLLVAGPGANARSTDFMSWMETERGTDGIMVVDAPQPAPVARAV
jgi:hypothetical protein